MKGTRFIFNAEAAKAHILPSHKTARLRIDANGRPSLKSTHRESEGVLPPGEKFGILHRQKDGTAYFDFPLDPDEIKGAENGFAPVKAAYHWMAFQTPTAEAPSGVTIEEIKLPDPPVKEPKAKAAPATRTKADPKAAAKAAAAAAADAAAPASVQTKPNPGDNF